MEFLSDEQAAAYGRFLGEPAREQLERFFWLDDADLARIRRRRRNGTALGYAVQLGTVRFLGSFLVDPLDVPWSVVVFVAGQLGIADPSCVKDYGSRPMTAHKHRWDIRREYGYSDFTERVGELRGFIEARAWLDARPIRRGKLAHPNEFGYLVQVAEVTANTKRGAQGILLPPKLSSAKQKRGSRGPACSAAMPSLSSSSRPARIGGLIPKLGVYGGRIAIYSVPVDGRA